jgi:DNA-binding NtrC family response regulator
VNNNTLAAETPRLPILLVEDTLSAEERCRDLLGGPGGRFFVRRAPDTHAAPAVLQEMADEGSFPKCVIIDLTLERNYTDAFPLIELFHKKHPRLPILIWTKHSEEIIEQAMDKGATFALKKYVNDKNMEKVVIDLIKRSNGSEVS